MENLLVKLSMIPMKRKNNDLPLFAGGHCLFHFSVQCLLQLGKGSLFDAGYIAP